MKYSMRPQGVCSSKVEFELDGNIIKNVQFIGGCNGNLKGIASLVEGKTVDEVSSALKGITCGFKKTSCPDQFAILLEQAYVEESANN